jgi:PAS domain S-box-containing protein
LVRTQPHGPDPAPETLGRLVHVSPRAVVTRALLIGLALCALVAVPFVLHYRSEVGRVIDRAKGSERAVVDVIAQTLSQEVGVALAHLRYLSRQNELREFLQDDGPVQAERLAREYLAFVEQVRRYDQVRVIDAAGQERVRVSFEDGRATAVPAGELQNKRDRHYFTETMGLAQGEVYVSPFDPNVESGALKPPPSPVIRFAVPIFDEGGARRGILLLSYPGEDLIQKARAIARTGDGELWLLDRDGYWLVGPRPEDEWGFMDPAGEASNLATRFPAAWQRVARETQGEASMPQGWVQFRRVYPLAADYPAARRGGLAVPPSPQSYYWTVASILPTAVLQGATESIGRELAASFVALALLCLSLALVLAYVSLRGRALARAMARVVDHVPDMIAYVDAEQRYRFNNRAYDRVFGLSAREIYGRTVREVVGEAAYELIRPRLEQALEGEEVSFEARIEYGGVGPRDVSVTYIPDIGDRGVVDGFVALVRDVTALKDAERRERRRMLELAHVARVNTLGQMTTEVAHEVNQPLAAIGAYSSACLNVLQRGGPEAPELREWLHAIRREAERVGDVIRRLRNFMKKGGGERVAADVNALVREVVRMAEWEARSHSARVRVALDIGVPEPVIDRILIEQVVLNLVRNALDAVTSMPPERRQVTVETRRDPGAVRIVVSDSGPGVPEELRSRLFDPFVTTKADGLGMGLAISRSIVEAHGGRLEHGATPEGGAMFSFTLPASTE